MTIELNPLTRTQHYFKLILRMDDHEALSDAYQLHLYVSKYWWETNEIEKALKNKKKFFISINEDDLRIPYLPEEMSELFLFNDKITVDHHADELKVLVNASIHVSKHLHLPTGELSGFEGVIKSGSIVFKNFKETFKDSDYVKRLFPSPDKEDQLLLGRSKIQLKEKKGATAQLYDYVGSVAKEDPDYIWKLIYCPHESLASPLEELKKHEDRLISMVERLHEGKAIQIEKFAQDEMGVYLRRGSRDEKYFKPALKVYIFQEGREEGSYGPPMIWTPQSLKVEGTDPYSYTLLDFDQIEQLLMQGETSNLDDHFDISVYWDENNRKIIVPDQQDEANCLFLTHATNSEVIHKNYLWKIAQLNHSYSEYSWTRYHMQECPITSEIDENTSLLTTQSQTLGGSLLKFYDFETRNNSPHERWKFLLNIPAPQTQTALPPAQLQMVIRDGNVKLKLHEPNVLAVTPEMSFYSKALRDPSSMPADKMWNENLKKSGLVFQNILKKSQLPLAKQSVHLQLNPGKDPSLHPNKEQVLYFKTAPLSVIDRISPSKNNLSVEKQETNQNDPPCEARDPNHGLLVSSLKAFTLDFSASKTLIHSSDMELLRKYSTEALMPWVERQFSSLSTSDGSDMKFYHRNLVLEHSEFEAGQVYKESEEVPTTYNASEAFVQAVRDRYTLAADLSNEKSLENWFPQATYSPNVTPKLSYDDQDEFPKVKVEWEGNSHLDQTLAINIPDKNWLDYQVKPTVTSNRVELKIEPVENDTIKDGYYHTVNSHAPLLLSEDSYYDNLGVLQKNRAAQKKAGWDIEEIYHDKKYFSLSAAGIKLMEQEESPPNHLGHFALTQILFSCDGLKVDKDGNVASTGSSRDFHESPISLGVFGFYSEVTALENSPLSGVNYWPRYKGAPFLVTEIQQFELSDSLIPESISFKAVLANPEELNAHMDPHSIPNFVLHALRNNQVIKFKYTFPSDDSEAPTLELLEGSSIDWQFSFSNHQTPHAINGKLTRLSGSLQLDGEKVQVHSTSNPFSSAFAFGKKWELKPDQPILESHTFFVKNHHDNYVQVDYDFHSKGLKRDTEKIHEGRGELTSGEKSVRIEVSDWVFEETAVCLLKDGQNHNYWVHRDNISTLKEGDKFYFIIPLHSDFDKSSFDCDLFSSTTQFINDLSVPKNVIGRGTGQKTSNSTIDVTRYTPTSNATHEFYGSFCNISKNGVQSTLLINKYHTKASSIGTMEPAQLNFDPSWQLLPRELESWDIEIFESPYLIISSSLKKRLCHHLPIKLALPSSLPRTEENLEALISNDSRLILYLTKDDREKLLYPTILQGDIYCFLSQSKQSVGTAVGEESVHLWSEKEGLSALVCKDLSLNASYASFFFADDKETPCEKIFQAGLDIDYLAPNNKWHRYTTLSLTLKKGNVTLRFDDQHFPDLSEWPEEYTTTGYLQAELSQNEIQSPVVAKLKKEGTNHIIITIEKSWFSINQVHLANEGKSILEPDIVSKYENVEKNYILRQAIPTNKQSFVELKYDVDGLQMHSIKRDLVPINFCLEPEATTTTSKLTKTAPQLLHRQMFGNMLRINLGSSLYSRPLNDDQKEPFNLENEEGMWLLSPIATNEDHQLVLMSDNAVLQETDEKQNEIQSESVLILNKPVQVNLESPPYIALSNRTTKQSASLEEKDEQIHVQKIQKKALEMGASGVILRRKIDHSGHITYKHVSSPFFGGEGVSHTATSQGVSPGVDLFHTDPGLEKTPFDFRSQLPIEIRRIERIRSSDRYIPIDAPKEDPDCCCAVKRELSYQYQGKVNENYGDEQPTVYLFETPAFKKMDPLWYLPPIQQINSAQFKEERNRAYFLPHQFHLRYGSDKAGAMFHHEMRNIIHKDGARCELGKGVQFAMREPQQIKTTGCITAAIEAVEFKPQYSNKSPFSSLLAATWKDVFGRIKVDDLNNNYSFEIEDEARFVYQPLFAKDEKKNTEFPFKLVVQHNYEVFALEDLEGSLPAYDKSVGTVSKYEWGRYFLASKSDTLIPPEPITLEIDDPDENNPEGKQVLTFDFKPYLMLAEVEIKDFNDNSIELKNIADVARLQNMGSAARVFIPGLQAEMVEGASTPWEIERIHGTTLTLKGTQKLHGTPEKKALIVVDLFSVMEVHPSEEGYFLWSFKLDPYEITPQFTKFQIMWLATGDRKLKIDSVIQVVKQMASCNFYTIPKIVKLLMPAITAPKVAGVLHLNYTENSEQKGHKKTLFFGNGKGPTEANVTIEKTGSECHVKLYADDEENIETPLPYPENPEQFLSKTHFYVLKYLIHGQVVYGEKVHEQP